MSFAALWYFDVPLTFFFVAVAELTRIMIINATFHVQDTHFSISPLYGLADRFLTPPNG